MRYLLTSWGSRGDLHPFLALGRGLLALGHAVTLVGHPDWGEETAAAGLRFVGTNEPPRDNFLQRHPEIFSRRWGGLASLRALVHHGMVPGFDGMLAALRTEAETHDVLVAHHFVFPAPIAAELTGRPWATVSLAPGVVPSAYARPGAQFGRTRTGPLARQIHRLTWISGQEITRRVVDPVVNRLRARHGLAPIRDAVFDAHSARLNLQLYSEHFAPRPPDWSAEKRYGGFCFYDPPDEPGLAPKLEEFLGAGEPPVLVTLGRSWRCPTPPTARSCRGFGPSCISAGSARFPMRCGRGFRRWAVHSPSISRTTRGGWRRSAWRRCCCRIDAARAPWPRRWENFWPVRLRRRRGRWAQKSGPRTGSVAPAPCWKKYSAAALCGMAERLEDWECQQTGNLCP
jgi:hypothetical protein